MIYILWKEEYIDITLVLTAFEQENDFYKTWPPCDQRQYLNFFKKI